MNRTSLLVLLALVAFLAVPAGAQTITQVTNNGSGFYDQYPAISEDGLTCAWCGKDPVTNTNQVWVADLKNLVSTMITSGAGLPIPYPIGISGDGTTVVYSSSNNIWVVPAAGGVAKQVTNYTGTKRVQTYGITVSRDGQFACYTTYNSTGPIYDIEVVDTTTGAVVNLTQHTTSDVGMGGISGDGKLVAFSANRGNVADQIWVANRDGTNIRQLTTFASGTAFYPKLDYFGKICTFESNQSGQYEVYTVYTDGTGLTDVSQNPGGADRVPWISADGDRVAWKSTRGGTNDVYMAYPDGTGLRKVSPFGNMSPSLTNDSHCINGDGTVLALASKYDYKGGNPEGDYEIYVWKDAFTAAGVARPGATITLTMEDATRPGAVYAVRCAFSRSPGIPIGGKIVPITPDVLFWLSGALPAVFQKFEGTLNAQGLGVAAVAIPNIPALTGIAFYSTFVSADPALEVYNPLKVLIW